MEEQKDYKIEYFAALKHIERLEKCISDFKDYDRSRSMRIRAMEVKLRHANEDIERWKTSALKINDDLELYLQMLSDAEPTILNPHVKAVNYKMIVTIQQLKKELRETKALLKAIQKNSESPIVNKIKDMESRIAMYKDQVIHLNNVVKQMKDGEKKK